MTTSAMSPLRQRMVEDMQLRGLSARTQEAYARAVWQLGQHYHRSPAQLSDEDLRHYFVYLTNQKKLARPTGTIAICVGGIEEFPAAVWQFGPEISPDCRRGYSC